VRLEQQQWKDEQRQAHAKKYGARKKLETAAHDLRRFWPTQVGFDRNRSGSVFALSEPVYPAGSASIGQRRLPFESRIDRFPVPPFGKLWTALTLCGSMPL
jgi:hypothetical protein